jgi:peroxiredoxin
MVCPLLGCLLALAGHAAAQADQLESWRPPTVPALTLPALDGATSRLSAEAGKLVIVHVFATWCEPCRDELKSLERLAGTLAARPFQILAIDVGEPGDRVRRFLERNKIGLRFPVLIDFDKQAMRAWDVEILPTSYVLDSRLCPLWKVAGALEWDTGPILSMLEAEVARLEQAGGRQGEENCIVTGGNQ